jgi:Uma2 family endonuclease
MKGVTEQGGGLDRGVHRNRPRNRHRGAASRAVTWKDLCLDSRFQDLPFKIELNGRGQIIMSPTRNLHGFFSFRIGELLKRHLPNGEVIMECAVDTADGTKEADAAWVSRKRWAIIRDQYSSSVAPEICVEVTSVSNTREELLRQKDLYLAAGAREYWLCSEDGKLEFHAAHGQMKRSALAPKFPFTIRKR